MKYAFLVGDGMGDYPLVELGGRTPLQAAKTPNLDALSRGGLLGLVRTIPQGSEPGSDVANMSILGYDPRVYHTGRGPLEAASLGVRLAEDEVAFRLNLVTLGFEAEGRLMMRDHSAGHITTEETRTLIADLAQALPLKDGQRLYPGVSYRHVLVWPGWGQGLPTLAPHDYRDQDVTEYLTDSGELKPLVDLIRASWPLLAEHPVNRRRLAAGLRPANSIWPWGQGRPPALPTIPERWGPTGAVVSAVDLIKGLGVYAGLTPVAVPGATGLLDTNFEGKVQAALEALQRMDLVFLHLEAPDEASHQGDLAEKIKAIEAFDARIVGPMLTGLEKHGPFRLLVLCDHMTPLAVKTHTPEPVPFVLYPAAEPSGRDYSEAQAAETGLFLDQGHTLAELFFRGSW